MAHTPDDPTKAQVWVTKGLDDIDFEFYFPQGPKGDPGGIVAASIPDVNLNSITSQGWYYPSNGSVITLANNYPVAGTGGYLEVSQWGGPGTIIQTFHVRGEGSTLNSPIGSRGFYKRTTNTGAVWSKWSYFGTSRIDQTAGRAMYQWDELNGREQLVYGDTGWRDVKALTINGWSSSSLQLRRVGNQVSLTGYVNATAATSDHYMVIPAGFAPPSNSVYHGVASNSAVPPVFRPLGTDNVDLYITSGGTSGTYAIQANYLTTSTWPTSLPGVALGAIPNV